MIKYLCFLLMLTLMIPLTGCGTLNTQDEQATWVRAQVEKPVGAAKITEKLGPPHRKPHDSMILIYRINDQDHLFLSTSDQKSAYLFHSAVDDWPINAPLPDPKQP